MANVTCFSSWVINSYFILLWRIHCWWWNILNFITAAGIAALLPRYFCGSTVDVNHSNCLILRTLSDDLNIFCCHFVKAHSVLSKCWTECSIFLKPVHPLKKTHTVECNIFTSCVFLWWCFLKNNINHPLSSQEEKVHVIDSHLAFSGWKVGFQTSLWTKKCNLATKTQYFCWTQWVVSESKGRFSPYTNPPTHAHIQSARIHMLLNWNILTSVDRAVHWGGLCFLSVGGRDEVMINMGDVWKCKSVLQHK